jgi:hypothetical protein
MFGLVALALLVLSAEDGLDPRWLLPIGWIWVNVHGSFPLGIAYLLLAAIGTRLDGGDPSVEIRCLKWAVPGMLAGALGPLGIRVLLFPVQLLGRQELLANVVEWQAPGFTDVTERAFLVQMVLAVVLLARRPSYRGALVIGVFTAAALLGSRNIVVASIVMLPSMAQGLKGIGTLDSRDRPGYARLVGVVAVGLGAIMISVRAGLPSLTLDKYPVDVVAYLEDRGVDTLDHHLAAPDYVGNFLEYVYGADGRVFYDDRFDMFPEEASDAALGLLLARPGALDALEPYDVELVTMPASSPTAQLLTLDPDWRVLYVDEKWVLACSRGVDLGGDLGRC